ncbi:Kinesin-like protein KIF11 [Phytophthora ramorum]|uniref:Kinesin-like protein KIF11 n=1 Tax=Phytophthora ramorum TaxID=164328 RepID=UPI0030B6A2E7|nr:Kinesin-like protein KIF11 [Phytophthora ramorum]
MTELSSSERRMSSSSVSSVHDAPPPPPTPTNVQVAVRCRPLNSREKASGRGAVVQCKPHSNEVAVVKRKTYTFDRVFGQYSTQKDVFSSVVRPAVDEALAGYNCTVFAYGQTGTGKTYTMQGDLSPDSETAGIIPRSVRCIFDALEASGEEFSVRVSFLQLYNEELKDLLDPETDKKLRLMEDVKRGGVYCVNLLEVTATTAKHVYELVNTGVKNRVTLDETLSTLEYAFRAKNIKNKPELNQKMTKAGLLNDFGSEIETLRAALRAARLKDGVYLPLEQFTDMQERLAGQGGQLTELEDTLKARDTACKELEEAAEKYASEVAVLTLAKQEVTSKLTVTEDELSSTKEMLEKTTQELRNAQAVLKSFQDNEQVLLANGATAAKLYNASEEHATQLLTKIENSHRADEANTALATSYRSESQSQINAFLERLAKHKESQEGMFQDASNALHELQNGQSADLDGLVTSLNALQSLVEARRVQTSDSLAEDNIVKRGQRNEMAASMNEQQKDMQKQLEKFVEMSKTHTTAIVKDLATSKSRNMSFLETVQSTLEGSREELNSFLTEQSDKLLELQVAIDMSVEKQTKELDESKTALTAALKDSHDQHQEELDGMKVHLAQYIEKCIQSQTQKLSEQTLLIEENAKKQQKQLSHVQTVTEIEVKGFVQSMGSQSSKHESETAALRERLSEMRGQLGETNERQTELAQSHERLQAMWSDDTAALCKKHTEGMSNLMGKHTKIDTETSTRREGQMTKFMCDHEDLRQLLDGGCNTLEKGLQNQIFNTKGKIDSASAFVKEIIGEVTEASSQQLHDMESYMKKRKVNARTGATPMKKDDRPFPSFEATEVDAEQLYSLENSPSHANSSNTESIPGRKRRRLSDASTSAIDDATHGVEDTTAQAQSDAPVSIIETTRTVTAGTSSGSSQESMNLRSEAAGAGSSATANAPETQTEAKTTIPVNGTPSKIKTKAPVTTGNRTPSKIKKMASSALHRKKPAVAHSHRSMKVPSAGARKITKTSTLTAPKRYRAKSPLGETTSFR